MLKHLIYQMRAHTHRRAAIAQLRSLEAKLPSPVSRFAVPFVFRGKGLFKSINPRQNPLEIEQLYHAICELSPTRVLEIGTAKGGSLYLWTQAARRDATVVSVDLPGGKYGGSYPEARVDFYAAFAQPTQKLHLLRLDSHLDSTLATVKEKFAGQSIDFAFIDGDHTFKGVEMDFVKFGPLVRPGGLIGFHDILPRPADLEIEVDQLWSKIKAKYPAHVKEFVGPEGSGKPIGIGLLRVPDGGLKW